jgi:hypothetical protein
MTTTTSTDTQPTDEPGLVQCAICGRYGWHTSDRCPDVAPPGEHLINGVHGRWLGARGIFCHFAPHVEDINLRAFDGEMTHQTMVTAVADWAPGVQGELIRWVTADEVSYEVRISGLDEHGGICDVAAWSIDSLWALAKVSNDLRYMWEAILDPENRGAWNTWSG